MAVLFVDDHTLSDLEIFSARDGGPCLFGILDKTKTKGGRAALRARFANPYGDAEAIRRVQHGIGYLIDHSVRFAVAQDLIDDVRWYLDSSWEVGTWKRKGVLFLDSIWVSLKYGELLSYAKHGVRATRDLMTQVVAMLEVINQSPPPPAVSDLTSELASLVDRVELGTEKAERRAWEVLEFDQRIRGLFRSDLHRLIELLFELDALCAMADATIERELVFPEIVDESQFVREVTESLVSGKRALVLFDELFRGTNTRDAIEASLLVILGFCNAKTSGFVISSHLLELAEVPWILIL